MQEHKKLNCQKAAYLSRVRNPNKSYSDLSHGQSLSKMNLAGSLDQ